MKKCNKCGETLALTEFGKALTNKDGLSGICKKCTALRILTRDRTKTGKIKQLYRTMKASCKNRTKKEKILYTVDFSLEEFFEWVDKNRFDSYHWLWLMSDYKKDFVPSVDRLNDYDGYNFNNMRLCMFKDNLDKAHKDRKNGVNNKHNSKVFQYDLNKNLITEFHSQREASRQTGFKQSAIGQCCLNKYAKRKNVYKGFIWSFK